MVRVQVRTEEFVIQSFAVLIFNGHQVVLRHEFTRHLDEAILNIFARLGTAFIDLEFMRFFKLLDIFIRHLYLGCQINLVAEHNHLNVSWGVFVDLLHPVLDIEKRLSVGHIEHNEHALLTSVIRFSDAFVSLLPCCVPLLVR